jgi:Protein kinase domain/GAF domain
MGAVFLGRHTQSGREVAIKRLLDTRHQARFEIEARLLSQLEHPRVVDVLDYFLEESGSYLVMDLVRGKDLGAVLKREGNPGLPVERAIEYVQQAAEALHYVHAQQIVHRDVKPQNLILDDEGQIILVDFGVARQMDDEEPTGTIGIGTPRYMAPEVFAEGAVSPRSDVFGLAATMWTLLSGKPPVYGEQSSIPGVSPELEQTIKRGLEIVPDRRIASTQALAAALGAPVVELRGQSLGAAVERPDRPRSLIEAVVRTAAGVFEAAAASIALIEPHTGELVYQAAWGAGAREVVGIRLAPGTGIAGSVIETGQGIAVPDCRTDERFAAQVAAGTGYVPHTMLVVPLQRDPMHAPTGLGPASGVGSYTAGVLSILDRRDGEPYGPADIGRAELFAELALAALEIDPMAFTALGASPRDVKRGTTTPN